MSGRYGRVGCEYTTAAHRLGVTLGNHSIQVAAQLPLHQTDRQQRRVTLVHVVDVYFTVEGVENAHTADPQHGLLTQPVICVSTIEVVRKNSIPGVVLRQVRVQQVDRDRVPGDPLEIVAPGTDHYWPAFNRHLNYGIFKHQEIIEQPRLVFRALNSLDIKVLVEISLAMQQRDGGEPQTQVGRRPHGVPRKHTQSSAVRGHLRRDGDFHREVSDHAFLIREACRRKITLPVRKMHPCFSP